MTRRRRRGLSSAAAGGPAAPSLSNPTDTKTGQTTATLTVDTDQGNGTLYWVLSSSPVAPTAAQVKLGQMHTGAAAAKSGSQAVTFTGTQTVNATALTAGTTYYAHFMHENATALQSSVASADGFTTDSTAPVLTLPTDTNTGTTTATLTVSTTGNNGTLYWVLSSSATPPSAAQVKLGQMHTGAAAAASGSQAVSVTGVQTVNATALTDATTYYAHFMHEDAGAVQSNVASGDGFTTGVVSADSWLWQGTDRVLWDGTDRMLIT